MALARAGTHPRVELELGQPLPAHVAAQVGEQREPRLLPLEAVLEIEQALLEGITAHGTVLPAVDRHLANHDGPVNVLVIHHPQWRE